MSQVIVNFLMDFFATAAGDAKHPLVHVVITVEHIVDELGGRMTTQHVLSEFLF